MPRTVTIELDKPLMGHGGAQIRHVVVREPTYAEYMQHGDPYVWVPIPGTDRAFPSENLDVIRAYSAICVSEPKDTLLLEQGGFEIGRKIKDAIMGFFLPAAAEAAGSKTSATS